VADREDRLAILESLGLRDRPSGLVTQGHHDGGVAHTKVEAEFAMVDVLLSGPFVFDGVEYSTVEVATAREGREG
jgi:hypothetical protein